MPQRADYLYLEVRVARDIIAIRVGINPGDHVRSMPVKQTPVIGKLRYPIPAEHQVLVVAVFKNAGDTIIPPLNGMPGHAQYDQACDAACGVLPGRSNALIVDA